jgi:hypothetical protein
MPIFITLLLILSSCAFKKEDENNQTVRGTQAVLTEDLKKLDSDGDLITDYEELVNGSDPNIADYPEVKVTFLQDYSIDVNFEEAGGILFDTQTLRDDPSFKYRVGDVFLRENAKKSAANFGRFSGVMNGEIKERDYSWVKYPDVDPFYYHKLVHDFKSYEEKKIKNVNIKLSNSLRLSESLYYNEIQNLEVNFYYYSYKSESYVLLHTEKINKVFKQGVREFFNVEIINAPAELIQDNYMRKGEFIISEVKDFYIPAINRQYSTLLNSIKYKTIPVYTVTPDEEKLQYVAIGHDGEGFISILQKIYPNKFLIQDEKLTQIQEFTNNLGQFRHLHEIKDQDKEGMWFVMTNRLKEHYLRHKFTRSDYIILSYLLGSELSSQLDEKQFGMALEINSEDTGKTVVLGNVHKNSNIDVSVILNREVGVSLNKEHGGVTYTPGQCRNCTGNNWTVSAEYVINSFTPYSLGSVDFSETLLKKAISVFINNTEISWEDVEKQNLGSIKLNNTRSKKSIDINLHGLDKLDAFVAGKENVAFIKINPISVNQAGLGLELKNVKGINIKPLDHAGPLSFNEAGRLKVPVAITSWRLNEWENTAPWDRPWTNGYVISRGQLQNYYEGIEVDVVSTITNNFN